jgi:hypothetical protein
MQTILLVTLRRPVAELLAQKMRNIPGVRLKHEPDYAGFAGAVASYEADTVLIEVQETGEHGIAYCLALCGAIRREAHGCRALLLCPEQDEEAVDGAVKAKRDGLIDDFLFYSATADYIVSKLLALF